MLYCKWTFHCANVRFIAVVDTVRGCEKMPDASVNERKTSDWVPASASTVAQMIRQHEELSAWLRGQSAELVKSYPDKWVGTGAGKILVFGDKLEDVVEQIESNGGNEGGVVVRFLSSRPKVMIL